MLITPRQEYTEILHDNGYRSVYIHLNNFAKINGMPIALGTKVSQVQVIAYVGNTGTTEHKQGLDSQTTICTLR